MQALGQVWGRIDPQAPDLRETVTPLETPTLYGAQTLVDVWRGCRHGFVVGRDIPSRPLSGVLRNLAVFEPIENGADFLVRLAGTALLRRFGRDISGAKMSELYASAIFERRREWLLDAVRTSRPVIQDIEMQHGNRMPLRFELILLPVLAPDHATPWVLAGFFYQEG